jgi:hypothetical protein
LIEVSKKFGYIDQMGKAIIEPQFDSASSLSESLAWVWIGNKGGYIDKTGKFVIQSATD